MAELTDPTRNKTKVIQPLSRRARYTHWIIFNQAEGKWNLEYTKSCGGKACGLAVGCIQPHTQWEPRALSPCAKPLDPEPDNKLPFSAGSRCTFRLPIHTNFTQLSPSWEAASCTPIQELPSILWNPKIHYRVHKSPPLVPTLSQINPVHTAPSYLSKIYFNIIHPPTWSLSFWLSHQYPICSPLWPPFVLMPCPSHPNIFICKTSSVTHEIFRLKAQVHQV
jgi:hypothetical protein